MCLKVSLFDKKLREEVFQIFGILSTLLSVIVIFVDIPQKWKLLSGIIFLIVLVLIYMYKWYRSNKLQSVTIRIGNSDIDIKVGDIFRQNGLKVIAFNEYFDTQVDNRIISEKSLNGQFIKKYVTDVTILDKVIAEDRNVKENLLCVNNSRLEGKTSKYQLGTSVIFEDEFILTAFSKFNENNEAELTMPEYVNFLLNFWNNVNRLYAQRSVVVPVLGSGITRFKNGFEDVDINELLQIMIWTFRVSKIKFAFPAKLTIVIHKGLIDRVDLYNIGRMNNGISE
ncbi:hypothetical protein SGGBAA2069_c18130 [Streptococcus gallolyticus subsp. gallolyticus ATCC BAA-2069]|nr:macro domain-containing protein [Streptococcus gallolyticus]CBZ48985.1 hypothetical protein SGGBAA2069_c18130 [Streptococcus gallolyticus subsp. gallolyticus ATCC BAA-2069]